MYAMLPWQQFDVVRCIFTIYTSSTIQLLNHTIHNIRHGYILCEIFHPLVFKGLCGYIIQPYEPRLDQIHVWIFQ